MDCWLLLRFFQLARLSARQVPCKDWAHTVEQDRNVISLHAWAKGCLKAHVRTANLCVHVVLPYFIHLCVDMCVVISGLIKRIKCLTRIHMHFHVLIRAMACQEWHVITFFIFSNLKWSAASCIPIWNYFFMSLFDKPVFLKLVTQTDCWNSSWQMLGTLPCLLLPPF